MKKQIYNLYLFFLHFFIYLSCHFNLTNFCAYLIKLSLFQPKIFNRKLDCKKILVILDRSIGGRRDIENIYKSTNLPFNIFFMRRSIAKIIFEYFSKKNNIFFNYEKPRPIKKDFFSKKYDKKSHEKFLTEVLFHLQKKFYNKDLNFITFAYYYFSETALYAACNNNKIPIKLWHKECFMSDPDIKLRIKLNEYKNVFKYFDKISVYNETVKNMIISMDKKNEKKVYVNSCPRVLDFKKKSKKKKIIKNILFLSFNTKQGIPRISENSKYNWNYSYDRVINILNELSELEYLNIVIKRKNSFTYKSSQKINKKIKIFERGTAERFINNADIIIGHNSGSTIEALINGKHVLIPFFEKEGNLKKFLYKFNNEIIYKSEKKMKDKILKLLNKKEVFPIKNKNHKKTIEYYYGDTRKVVQKYVNFLNN